MACRTLCGGLCEFKLTLSAFVSSRCPIFMGVRARLLAVLTMILQPLKRTLHRLEAPVSRRLLLGLHCKIFQIGTVSIVSRLWCCVADWVLYNPSTESVSFRTCVRNIGSPTLLIARSEKLLHASRCPGATPIQGALSSCFFGMFIDW